MQRYFVKLLATLLLGALPWTAFAQQPASRDDAIQFVKKAVAHLRQQGKDKALQDFNNPQGAFVDRELYIIVLDMTGVLLADPLHPKLINKPLFDLRDVNGKYFVREELKLAKEKGKGWVDFQWLNPVSKNMEPRSSYIEKVDDLIVLTGVFQKP
ncbi:cache domain-containing protein [Pseudoduganella namucuonensis]|uniref:Single Cache domain 2-containing protein n=1 Tax=Pseudoduganella namucuonensis TaxID=1035707 RepID=A0A1I7LPG3_9BURK|nr:cache domain-containing protein [Pseudoduganella namucuonensis]SFV11509.1 Single Cache domain 2-containing protein [Pseudoduganella namucuonensis]